MAGAERDIPGNHFGFHRVLDSRPALPQAADRLDNTLPLYANEILIAVEKLNIDAASFVQMEKETGMNPDRIAAIILDNCRKRGKQQNHETGSGGICIGRVAQVGSRYRGPAKLKVGDRVASMVSLTLTPLHLDKIHSVDLPVHQVRADGHAILFESSIAATLPRDISESVAMSVLDVAGAPALVESLGRVGKTVVVIGAGGKAGILSCVAARRKIGRTGKLIAIEPFERAASELEALGICDEILTIDATDPAAVRAGVESATRGKMGDVVVNVASVPHTENSSLLSVKQNGKVLFFSMATSFTKVTLGAEGIASSAQLLFGNGYYPNHVNCALGLIRKNKKLRELFYRRYDR